MKTILVYLGALLLLANQAFATTFVEADYVNVRQEGKVQVTCRDGVVDEYASFWCEGSYLSPASSAEFSTQKRTGLHHVRLTIDNASGRLSDTWKLNPLNGKTWLNIPLSGQNGILALGDNKIHYAVETSKDEIIEEGDFTTAVSQTPVKHCRPMWVNSSNSLDCQVPKYACHHLNGPRAECDAR